MSKKPEKKIEPIKFDPREYMISKKAGRTSKSKELTWIPMSEPFQEALGIPGVPRGYTTLSRGYSNTGKSTGIYEAIIGCNKIGDLPIIIDTENNFNWEHAKTIGLQYETVTNEYGEEDYIGDFMYFSNRKLLDMYQNYDYKEAKEKTKPVRYVPVVEDVSRLIDELLTDQAEGRLPRNLCFLWDSIGSLDCFKSVMSKSSNNQWNAGALESSFKSILNFRIPDSQREDSEFTNTFFAVQKIWLDNENQVIKHKGGEAFFYGARLIIHFGGILTHGTSKLNAETKGMKYQYGIETRVKCEKNQVNGIELMGRIASTSHGYWNPEKLEEYKKNNREYILSKLNQTSGEISLSKEDVKEID